MTEITEAVERATRPIVGMHNRTAQEVFDIMCDRVRFALQAASDDNLSELTRLQEEVKGLRGAVSKAATQFQYYAEQHAEKVISFDAARKWDAQATRPEWDRKIADATAKAKVNADLAKEMAATLQGQQS